RARLVLFASAVIPALAEWVHRRPRLDPFRYLGLRVLDDSSYAAGVWEGCITERTISPLLPHITGKNK
ncbi:MAG: mycofactocin biosynthesis glycosyltransferase MftF, partial [Acidimicrobiales bacterium]